MAIGVKHDPICPRCGYDLRGTAATWADGGSCPLDGVCTECGLTFRWVDVFDPTREEPKWCVEYATRRPLRFGRAVIGTLLRSWLPWVFWKRLRLHHEVRLRRIVVYLFVILALPLSFIYMTTQVTTAVYVRYQLARELEDDRYWASIRIENTTKFLDEWKGYEQLDAAVEEARKHAVWVSQSPSGDYRLFEDADELDAFVQGLSAEEWESLWGGVVEVNESDLEQLRLIRDNPSTVGISYTLAIAEAVFFPWRVESFGSFTSLGEMNPYPAPREILMYCPGAPWWLGDDEYVVGEVIERAGWFIVWLILIATYPLTFALLPITRRRAKVRWRHFARIGLYSMAIPIVFFHLFVASFAASLWHEDAFDIWDEWIDVITGFGPAPFALLWWYFAIRLHLRLPHALAVTVVMGVLSLMAVLAGAWAVFNVVAMLAN